MNESERAEARRAVFNSLAKELQCRVCRVGLPNAHLLDMHISESHDSFFRAQVDRGLAVYQCLMETCPEKFKSVSSRRHHLEARHRFCASMMDLPSGRGIDCMHMPRNRPMGRMGRRRRSDTGRGDPDGGDDHTDHTDDTDDTDDNHTGDNIDNNSNPNNSSTATNDDSRIDSESLARQFQNSVGFGSRSGRRKRIIL
jgi:hypothetical protein